MKNANWGVQIAGMIFQTYSRLFIKDIKEVVMFRKKNGQEFMDETNLDSSTNDKEEKKGFFHRKKKKEINLYEDISRMTVISMKTNMIKN